METMKFSTEINATRTKVWDVLFGEKTYPIWAAAFSEGSRAETDWQKGSKALFLDQSNNGMVSRIADHIPNTFLSIEHLGMTINGVEDYDSEAVKTWVGAKENYTLVDLGGKTLLTVDLEMHSSDPELLAYFNATFPKALAQIKALAEDEIIPPVVV